MALRSGGTRTAASSSAVSWTPPSSTSTCQPRKPVTGARPAAPTAAPTTKPPSSSRSSSTVSPPPATPSPTSWTPSPSSAARMNSSTATTAPSAPSSTSTTRCRRLFATRDGINPARPAANRQVRCSPMNIPDTRRRLLPFRLHTPFNPHASSCRAILIRPIHDFARLQD